MVIIPILPSQYPTINKYNTTHYEEKVSQQNKENNTIAILDHFFERKIKQKLKLNA